jgi:hypothetical protein
MVMGASEHKFLSFKSPNTFLIASRIVFRIILISKTCPNVYGAWIIDYFAISFSLF